MSKELERFYEKTISQLIALILIGPVLAVAFDFIDWIFVALYEFLIIMFLVVILEDRKRYKEKLKNKNSSL